MSTNPAPSFGGDKKPAIKDNKPNKDGQKGNNLRRDFRKPFPTKKQFQGSHPDLSGCIFSSRTTRQGQVYQFIKTDERIKATIGTKYDPHVLESHKKGTIILPTTPIPMIQDHGMITKTDEIIFNKEYDRFISLCYTIEKELKQTYSLYYGQCDSDIKLC